MPNIVIRCPSTRAIVSTGISTTTIIFDTLPNIAVPLQCPACNAIHNWKPKDAWVLSGASGVKLPELGDRQGGRPFAEDVVRPVHPKATPVILTAPEEIETCVTAPAEEGLPLQRPLPGGTLKIVATGTKADGEAT